MLRKYSRKLSHYIGYSNTKQKQKDEKVYELGCITLHDEREEHPHECAVVKKYLEKSGYKVIMVPLRCIFITSEKNTSKSNDPISTTLRCNRLVVYITCHGTKGKLNKCKGNDYLPYIRRVRRKCKELCLILCACHS